MPVAAHRVRSRDSRPESSGHAAGISGGRPYRAADVRGTACSGRPRRAGWSGERRAERELRRRGARLRRGRAARFSSAVAGTGSNGEALAAAGCVSAAACVLVTGLVRWTALLVSQARTAVVQRGADIPGRLATTGRPPMVGATEPSSAAASSKVRHRNRVRHGGLGDRICRPVRCRISVRQGGQLEMDQRRAEDSVAAWRTW